MRDIFDKNGSNSYIFVGESHKFSGVIKRGDVYYVPLDGNMNKTFYYRFNTDKERHVHRDDRVVLTDAQEKDIERQRWGRVK